MNENSVCKASIRSSLLMFLGIAMNTFCVMAQSPYGTQVGLTYYDVPSNYSGFNRIVYNEDDQSVSVTWIQSITPLAQPTFELGAGYNHYTGGNWLYGMEGACRVNNGCTEEYSSNPEMINFPIEYTFFDGSTSTEVGRELLISDAGGLKVTSRSDRGSGNWFTSDLFVDQDVCNQFTLGSRPRAVSQGNHFIHLIASQNETVSQGNPPCLPYSLLKTPFFYYRSSNQGYTWDIKNILLPGMEDTTLFKPDFNFIDRYAISVNNDVVAIIAGGFTNPVVMWKSNNRGITWDEPKIVYDIENGFKTNRDTLNDSTVSKAMADGSFDIVVDNNGSVHCFYGQITGWFDTKSHALKKTSRMNNTGIYYWSDKYEDLCEPVKIADVLDVFDADGLRHSVAKRWLDTGYDPYDFKNNSGNNEGHLFGVGLASMPSVSLDDSGQLFVVYSAEVEGTMYTDNHSYLDSVRVRDNYLVWSNDGGQTWSKELNISSELAAYDDGTSGTGIEDDIFPCVPQRIGSDRLLHIMWNQDYIPGSQRFWDNSSTFYSLQYISYFPIDVSTLTMDVGLNIDFQQNMASIKISETDYNLGDTALITTNAGNLNFSPYVPFFQYYYDTSGVLLDSIDLNNSNDSIWYVVDSTSSSILNLEIAFHNACANKDALLNLNIVNGAKQAIIEDDTIQICQGNSIELFGYGSGDSIHNYSYEWIGLNSGQSTFVTPVMNQSYYFTIGNGVLDSIFINVNTLPVAYAGPSATIYEEIWCSGSGNYEVQIGALPTDSGYTYAWTPYIGTNLLELNQSFMTVRPPFTETYAIVVTDLETGCVDTDSVEITVVECELGQKEVHQNRLNIYPQSSK